MNKYYKKKILSYYLIGLVVPVLLFFFKLQVIDYQKYKRLSGKNSIRSVEIKAPRGIIYDRNNIPLVDNLPTYSLKVIPVDVIDRKTKSISDNFNIELLESIIDFDKEAFISKVMDKNQSLEKFIPVTIKRFIKFEERIMIEERIEDFPGILFSTIPARKYVSRVNLSHALGYLGLVDKEKKTHLNHVDSLFKYSLGDVYGRSGIEKAYEYSLRGKNGIEYRLVDNRGVDQGQVIQKDNLDVFNGPPLFTTIDLEIQSIVEKSLSNNSGAIICMDPSNGEILAFASSPDYDLKSFIGPVPKKQWDEWNTDSKTPLLNRVISGEYPPGSVFKLVTAALLLKKNQQNNIYECSGEHEVGVSEFKKCWNPSGHGKINLAEALKFSCNVYFYKAIENITFEDLALTAQEFNFGNRVGINIPSERKGLIPTPNYMRKKYEFRDENGLWITDWARRGTKANMGIGQGDVLATPLQVINLINIIANKGYSYTPHLVIGEKNIIKKNIDLGSNIWKFLNKAMWDVVNSKDGTGKSAKIYDKNVNIRGKTGTAQNPHGEDHSWFAGYMTARNLNKISVVVMIEHGGRGSGVASLTAKDIFSYFSSINRD